MLLLLPVYEADDHMADQNEVNEHSRYGADCQALV
jgi:hypothetical protein